MHMQVKDNLAAGRLVELLDGKSVCGKDCHRRAGNRLGRLDDVHQVARCDIENGAGRGFWDDQGVAGRPRHDVEKGKYLVVLEDFMCRQFAAQNFGKDVVRVVARHHRLRVSPRELSHSGSTTKSLRNGASVASSLPAAAI